MADITIVENVVHVQGIVNFANVMSAYAQSLSPLSTLAEWRFDLKKLVAEDSAAVALLVEWIKLAKKQRKALRFVNIPSEIAMIIKSSGLDALLQYNTAS